MFSLVNVGERSGIGLCDVYSAWKSYGYKQPEFKESVDPDRITLTLQIECAGANDNNGTNGGVNHGANEGDTEGCGVNSGTNEKYGANEINIIAYIKENPTASSSIISEALSIPLRTVQRILTSMQKDGVIRNAGTRKKMNWIVVK